jgi:hypothetical protein
MASWRRLLGFVAISIVSLVVAHNLVFLLAYGSGFDEALAHSGHDGAWGTAVIAVLSAALTLTVLAAWRLYRLGIVARSLSAGEGGLRPAPTGFARQLLRLWIRLTAATTVLFVIQENLEHGHIGESLPGLSVLGSTAYPNAALVIAAVALAVALVVALFRAKRDVLVDRILAARARWHRASRMAGRAAVWLERRHASLVVHQFAGRAPPRLQST